jgi:hypothetical protein
MIFDNEYVSCSVDISPDDIVTLRGNIKNKQSFDLVEIFAANPIDRMTNYSGSGLPFSCSRMAFESTPNYEVVKGGSAFDVSFIYPNSYYTEDWFHRVPPSIFFKFSRADGDPMIIRFELPHSDDILNVRTLTYRKGPRSGPECYAAKEGVIPICGAEETMRRYKDAKIYQDLA